MKANAGSLADLQRAFQDYVLASDPGFTAKVRDTSKADRTLLLDVYRDGYALRLIEVLTNDFPGLLAMAGPEDFDRMARAYVAACRRAASTRPAARVGRCASGSRTRCASVRVARASVRVAHASVRVAHASVRVARASARGPRSSAAAKRPSGP